MLCFMLAIYFWQATKYISGRQHHTLFDGRLEIPIFQSAKSKQHLLYIVKSHFYGSQGGQGGLGIDPLGSNVFRFSFLSDMHILSDKH